MAEDFLARAYQFFLSRGYPSHAAAALAANAIAESGGNTRAVHDSGTGVGIYGFRDPKPGEGRKTALLAFAKARDLDPYAESTQLEFAAHELNTSEKKWGDALKASKDYAEAQQATLGFLRPGFYKGSNTAVPADRWNPGATLAGVSPVMGPTMAAAGSADTPVVAPPADTTVPSLLAPSTPIDTTAATAALAKAQKDKEEEAEFAALTRSGMGLLEKATPEAPPFAPMAAKGGLHIPEAELVPLPNYTQQAQAADPFTQVMMQQRLQRRV